MIKISKGKLSLLAVVVLGTIVLFEVAFYIERGKLWPAIFYPTDEAIRPIIVKQSGGSAMLDPVCGSRDYITSEADYIIEGKVESVNTGWNERKTSIVTYTDLAIKNYVKGSTFTENEIVIITPGGRVEEITQQVEDQPIFYEGRKVRIYFKKYDEEFSIVCAQKGG